MKLPITAQKEIEKIDAKHEKELWALLKATQPKDKAKRIADSSITELLKKIGTVKMLEVWNRFAV